MQAPPISQRRLPSSWVGLHQSWPPIPIEGTLPEAGCSPLSENKPHVGHRRESLHKHVQSLNAFLQIGSD